MLVILRASEVPADLAKFFEPLSTGDKSDTWDIAKAPFPLAHFATFPPALVTPCILAGTSERGACPACGAPWERMARRDMQPQAYEERKYDSHDPMYATKRNMGGRYQAQLDANPMKTLGWRPTCACGTKATRPCVVLDPFGGAGTVPLVAQNLGRVGIGVELKAEYLEMAAKRTAQASLL